MRELGSDIPSGIRQIAVETQDCSIDDVLLQPHEVVVEIRAAAVNFPDLLMTHGGYQYKPKLPYVPGTEASGIIFRVGQDVENFSVGESVICVAREGMMQSYVVVPAVSCSPLPAGLTFVQGASFNVAYTTAYHCLIERANLTRNDSVLINGATGGVGSAAIEIARAVGCKIIIATGTGKQKMEAIKGMGATHTINFAKINVEEMPRIVKGITKDKGVNVVYDPVGGVVWDKSLKSTAWGARLAIVGWASNVQPSVKTNYTLIKGLTILGCRAGESARRGFVNQRARTQTLYKWATEGKLKPNVSHNFVLEDIQTAFKTVYERKVVGKAVIKFRRSQSAKL